VSEIADVLEAIESLHERGQRMALATIVAVRGSTYRRPGARLLVPEDGAPIGNLSGGCLEGDVADVARVVMREGTARLAAWDLTADDDAVWGLGLGCNGAIEVFIEPADRAVGVAGALRTALELERPIGLVTVVESGETAAVTPGSRLVVHPDGRVEGSLGSDHVEGAAVAAVRELLPGGRSELRSLPLGVRAFVEVLEPPVRLIVCGAGHDAVPLVRAAAALGWSPVVVDDRPAFLSSERFPEAAFVHVDDPEAAAKVAPVDDRSCVVVMTHNFLRDKAYLRGFASTPLAYLGVLGPAARTQRLLMELADEGVPVAGLRDRLHGPAGLDLGAEGPEEIAHAIVAEIVAVRHGREGGFLRSRPGPIHDRPVPGTEARRDARHGRSDAPNVGAPAGGDL
jgi:xanthine dehydrogenase accessory factor